MSKSTNPLNGFKTAEEKKAEKALLAKQKAEAKQAIQTKKEAIKVAKTGLKDAEKAVVALSKPSKVKLSKDDAKALKTKIADAKASVKAKATALKALEKELAVLTKPVKKVAPKAKKATFGAKA
jgi:ribosomal protein L7/L12